MHGLERTISTARALLNEATRIYRGESGGRFTAEEIIELVQKRLKEVGLGTVVNAATSEIEIIPPPLRSERFEAWNIPAKDKETST